MALYPEGTSPLPLDDVQRAANKSNELSRQALGQNGAAMSDAAGVPSGNYVAIQCVTETEFEQLDTLQGAGENSPFYLLVNNAIPLAPGTIIYGSFTDISATTGVYIAYKA